MQTKVHILLAHVFVNKETETSKFFPKLLIYPLQYRYKHTHTGRLKMVIIILIAMRSRKLYGKDTVALNDSLTKNRNG
jgi:hypothetical protein